MEIHDFFPMRREIYRFHFTLNFLRQFHSECKLQDRLHIDMAQSILLKLEDIFIGNIEIIEDVSQHQRELDYILKVKILPLQLILITPMV